MKEINAKILNHVQIRKHLPLLQALSEEELGELTKHLTLWEAKVGDVIVKQGEKSERLFFLLEGSAQVVRTPEERDKKKRAAIIALLSPGAVIGEISFLNNTPHTADVITTFPSQLLVLERKEFLKHAASWPGLTLSLLQSLAKRLEESTDHLSDFIVFDVSKRITKTLQSLATEPVTGSPGLGLIATPPTHGTLAGMVGCSREVVSRTLKILRASGEVRITRGGWVVQKR